MYLWVVDDNLYRSLPLEGSVVFSLWNSRVVVFFLFPHSHIFSDFFFLSLGGTNTAFHRRRSHRCWIAFHFQFPSTSSWIRRSRPTWTGDTDNELWLETGWKTFCYQITNTGRLLVKCTRVQKHLKLLVLDLLKVKISTEFFISLWLKAIKPFTFKAIRHFACRTFFFSFFNPFTEKSLLER